MPPTSIATNLRTFVGSDCNTADPRTCSSLFRAAGNLVTNTCHWAWPRCLATAEPSPFQPRKNNNCVGKHYGSCNRMQAVSRKNSMSIDSDSRMTASTSASFRRRNNTILPGILRYKSDPTYQSESRGTPHSHSRPSSVSKDRGGLRPSARIPHNPDPALPLKNDHNPQHLRVPHPIHWRHGHARFC